MPVEAISIRELTKDFPIGEKGRYLRAVDNLSLSIEENAVFGLLGPNGSGKSTTIKALLGLTRSTKGECFIYGNRSADLESRSRIGYLPDAPYFYAYLTGLELLEFYAKLIGLEKEPRRAECLQLLDRFGIADAADRKIAGYSKGMLQRLGFAQALLGNPDILILDEPTAGVDPVGAAEVGEYILELKEKGKTVLLCSHLLTQVEGVCDCVGIMNKGRLLASGPISELLADDSGGSLRIAGLSSEDTGKVEAIATECGARIERENRSLDELFRLLVKEDEPE